MKERNEGENNEHASSKERYQRTQALKRDLSDVREK